MDQFLGKIIALQAVESTIRKSRKTNHFIISPILKETNDATYPVHLYLISNRPYKKGQQVYDTLLDTFFTAPRAGSNRYWKLVEASTNTELGLLGINKKTIDKFIAGTTYFNFMLGMAFYENKAIKQIFTLPHNKADVFIPTRKTVSQDDIIFQAYSKDKKNVSVSAADKLDNVSTDAIVETLVAFHNSTLPIGQRNTVAATALAQQWLKDNQDIFYGF